MALPVNPDEPGGGGAPGGGDPPPTDPATKIALQVTSTNVTITTDQISAAGGPWSSFKVRVTPVNANGPGTPQTVNYPVPAA